MMKCHCGCACFIAATKTVQEFPIYKPQPSPSFIPLPFQKKPSFLNPQPLFQPAAYKPPTFRVEIDYNTCKCGHSRICHKLDYGQNANKKFMKHGFI